MKNTAIPAPIEGFLMETLDGEIVLLHPTRNIMIYSNQTGALIWQLCDGVRSIHEITDMLSATYPEAQDAIRADVPETIQILAKRGALRLK